MRSLTETSPCSNETGKIIADITFSGLCVVRVGQADGEAGDQLGGESGSDRRRPRRARDIEVLLVDTLSTNAEDTCGGHRHGAHHGADHRHYPCLTYYAEDDLGLHARSDRWNGVLLPSPEGKEVVSIDLSQKRVEIIPPWPYGKDWSELAWCSEPALHPSDPLEDDRLDWILQSQQMGLETVQPERAIAVVTGLPGSDGKRALPNGEWRSGSVHRNREVRSRRPIRWKVGSLFPAQTLARDLVLRLPCLRTSLTLRISSRVGEEDPYDVVLTPGGNDRLRLSISNLPRSLGEPWDSHLGMLTKLGSGRIVDIVQDDHLVCVTGTACDIGMYLE